MAYALSVDVIDPDGEIYVTHTFWGDTEKEARENYAEHAEEDESLEDAIDEDRVQESGEEVPDDQLPTAEEEAEEEEVVKKAE
jgi:hypothetical protein